MNKNKNKNKGTREKKRANEHKVYVSMENVFAINKFVLTEKEIGEEKSIESFMCIFHRAFPSFYFPFTLYFGLLETYQC